MKTLIALIGLALLSAGITHGQTTNAAPISPAGVTVVQAPGAVTTTTYKPGSYTLNAAATTALIAPAQTTLGLTPPTGTVTARLMVIVYSDGTSRVTVGTSDPAKLPTPGASPVRH